MCFIKYDINNYTWGGNIMNCFNDNKHNNSKSNKSSHNHMSHMWMMVLCCGAPVLLIILLPVLSGSYPGFKSFLTGVIPFLCPLMMLFMIPMMLKNNKGNDEKQDHCETRLLDEKVEK